MKVFFYDFLPIHLLSKQEDAKVIEQLKLDKELLTDKLKSIEAVHEEQLRTLRGENYGLQVKVLFLFIKLLLVQKIPFRLLN